MRWHRTEDELFAGPDARRIMEAAEMGLMLGTWQERTCYAFELGAGRVMWVRVTVRTGTLHCVANAPDDGRRELPDSEMFAAPLPDTWLTKWRAGLFKNGASKPRKALHWSEFEEGGFAFGVDRARRVALLVRVWGVDDPTCQPREVQPSPDAPCVPAAGHSGAPWHGLTKWKEAAAKAWQDGAVEFKGYRALTHYLWRTSDPGAWKAAQEKGAKAASEARAARRNATR